MHADHAVCVRAVRAECVRPCVQSYPTTYVRRIQERGEAKEQQRQQRFFVPIGEKASFLLDIPFHSIVRSFVHSFIRIDHPSIHERHE